MLHHRPEGNDQEGDDGDRTHSPGLVVGARGACEEEDPEHEEDVHHVQAELALGVRGDHTADVECHDTAGNEAGGGQGRLGGLRRHRLLQLSEDYRAYNYTAYVYICQ